MQALRVVLYVVIWGLLYWVTYPLLNGSFGGVMFILWCIPPIVAVYYLVKWLGKKFAWVKKTRAWSWITAIAALAFLIIGALFDGHHPM